MDGSSRRNLARYASHSCQPECRSPSIVKGKVIFRAIEASPRQITYDYGENISSFLEAGCKCEKCMEDRRRRRVGSAATSPR